MIPYLVVMSLLQVTLVINRIGGTENPQDQNPGTLLGHLLTHAIPGHRKLGHQAQVTRN